MVPVAVVAVIVVYRWPVVMQRIFFLQNTKIRCSCWNADSFACMSLPFIGFKHFYTRKIGNFDFPRNGRISTKKKLQ